MHAACLLHAVHFSSACWGAQAQEIHREDDLQLQEGGGKQICRPMPSQEA